MEEKNSYLSADPETIRQIDEKMPPEEELQDLAEFFKVFGDATRLKILSVLLCSEMCVYDIATLLGMSQSAISPSVTGIEADGSGEEPQRRQDDLLCTGG